MNTLSMPAFEFFMNAAAEMVTSYPYTETWERVKDQPFVILHTSGSTGIPKPVFVTQGTFACNDAHQMIPSLGGKPTTVHLIQGGKRLFLAFPLFHAANLTFTIGLSVYSGVTCVLAPPGPLSPKVVDEVHTYGKLDGSIIPPSMLVDAYKTPGFLDNIVNRVKFLAYVGGTLPREVGNVISPKVRLITLMGATETMLLPLEVQDEPEDWEYLPVSSFLGAEFRPHRDGLRELVIVRDENKAIFQGCFSTFTHLEEYPMKDLYEPHLTKSGKWLFRARADDIICFTNAEKLNPITMESVISAHPAVKSAVVAGHGEFQTSLLIEPQKHPSTPEEREALLTDIWPTILNANRDCPAHGRIMKKFIMLTSPDKPMPRAGKDTVQRHQTLTLYANEIKSFYESPTMSQSHKSLPVNASIQIQNSQPVSAGARPEIKPATGAPVKTVESTQIDATMAPPARRSVSDGERDKFDTLVTKFDSLFTKLDAVVSKLNAVIPTPVSHTKMAPSQLESGVNAHAVDTAKSSGSSITSLSEDSFRHSEASSDLTTPELRTPPSKSTFEAIFSLQKLLHDVIVDNTQGLHDLTYEADLFRCGLDSLQVPILVEQVNDHLSKMSHSVEHISVNMVYNHSSINKLVAALLTA